MKKFYLLIATLLTGLCTDLQSQVIPNAGFEEWSQMTFFEEPSGYISTNYQSFISLGVPNVSRSDESYSGSYAVRLETMSYQGYLVPAGIFIGNPGDENSGLPFNGHPDTLMGYTKFNIVEGDSALVFALFTLMGNPIGWIMHYIGGVQESYTQFKLPVNWFVPSVNPDTLKVYLLSSGYDSQSQDGSVIFFDNLEFTGTQEQFPNGDFENWDVNSAEEPDSWHTSNVFSGDLPAATKTTDSYEGTFALKLENVFTIFEDTLGAITNGRFGGDNEGPAGGMPIWQIPDKLSGFYKYYPSGPDSALARVALYRYDAVLDSTLMLEEQYVQLAAADQYTYFEVPVDYNEWPYPDTVNIAFAAGNIIGDSTYFGLGSVLYLDALQISYKPVGMNSYNENSEIRIWPNPAVEQVFVSTDCIGSDPFQLKITDMSNRILFYKNFEAGQTPVKIDISGLKPGVYLLQIIQKETVRSARLMIRN